MKKRRVANANSTQRVSNNVCRCWWKHMPPHALMAQACQPVAYNETAPKYVGPEGATAVV